MRLGEHPVLHLFPPSPDMENETSSMARVVGAASQKWLNFSKAGVFAANFPAN
jgi:hypothetical protein